MVIPNRLPRGNGIGIVDKIVTREMKLGCWTGFLVLPRRVVNISPARDVTCPGTWDSPEAMTMMINPKPERYLKLRLLPLPLPGRFRNWGPQPVWVAAFVRLLACPQFQISHETRHVFFLDCPRYQPYCHLVDLPEEDVTGSDF